MANHRRFILKLRCITYKGSKCERCGYDKCIMSLTFHHRNPEEKLFTISGNHTRKWESVQKELDKCELLCHNCHHEEHWKTHNEAKEYKLLAEADNLDSRKIVFPKNYCSCGMEIKYYTKKCRLCSRKVIRPSKEELSKLLWEIPKTHIAKLYGVRDNTIKKWAKAYGLNYPSKGYWQKKRATQPLVVQQ